MIFMFAPAPADVRTARAETGQIAAGRIVRACDDALVVDADGLGLASVRARLHAVRSPARGHISTTSAQTIRAASDMRDVPIRGGGNCHPLVMHCPFPRRRSARARRVAIRIAIRCSTPALTPAMPRGGGECANIMRRGLVMPEIEGGFFIDSASHGFADHVGVASRITRGCRGDGALSLGAN